MINPRPFQENILLTYLKSYVRREGTFLMRKQLQMLAEQDDPLPFAGHGLNDDIVQRMSKL